MENIVQSNNRDLRLVAVKVGVLSTLRLALPDVPANATRVEVIVTNGDTHTAYGAHLDTDTKRWLVDIAAAQFPVCGKQKYEIAYLLDGKQFWDGSGWVTVEDATTGGITPSPAPDPARYVVTRINGYGAPNPDGEVRIPRTFVGTEDPTTTDGFIEFDQFFNRITGSFFVLCSVRGELTWVKSYITSVSTTFTSADAGKAADAKAVGEKFAEQFGHISSIGNMASNADGKADVALNAAGFAEEKANNALAAAGEAKESVTDATKLTPVLDADGHVTGYKLGDKASPVLLTDDAKAALFAGDDFTAAVRACFGNAETTEYGTEA